MLSWLKRIFNRTGRHLDARLALRRQLRADRITAAHRGEQAKHINRMTACAETTAALRGE